MASFGTAGGSADAGAAAEDSAAGSKARALVAPEAGSGEVVVVMSGVDHTSDRLDVTARELDDGTLDPIADLSAESPSLGPIATPIGARAVPPRSASRPTPASWSTSPRSTASRRPVLVVHSDQGRTAWAVDRSCTTGNTGLIRGPVSLD